METSQAMRSIEALIRSQSLTENVHASCSDPFWENPLLYACTRPSMGPGLWQATRAGEPVPWSEESSETTANHRRAV
jgi:hypothetical protein